MKDAGIFAGDWAIVKKQPSVDNGEIAVVILDGEATLKRFSKQRSKVVLIAENSAYDDIIASKDVQIQVAGKLVGVVRKI